jgi:hypothetical protein
MNERNQELNQCSMVAEDFAMRYSVTKERRQLENERATMSLEDNFSKLVNQVTVMRLQEERIVL